MLNACPGVVEKKHDTELRIELINGSSIFFKSGEVLENLRSETLSGVVIDEVRQQDPSLWPLVIRPMLGTTQGWAAFVSTTNGFDAFYDLAELARQDTTGLWSFHTAPSTCNPLFTLSEAEQARQEMSDLQYRQEILAEFVNIHQGTVYKNFGNHNFKDSSPFTSDSSLYSPYLPLLLGCDFNLNPMSWTLGQERNGQYYWFDEIYLENSHTQEASRELIERLKPYEIEVYPKLVIAGDPAGGAGQRAAAGKSDYSILMEMLSEAGVLFENKTQTKDPGIKDRVNMVNLKLKAADGSVSMWLHPTKVPHLKRDLERVAWKSGSLTLDKTSDLTLTHPSDGVAYAVCALSPMWEPKAGVSRVRRA